MCLGCVEGCASAEHERHRPFGQLRVPAEGMNNRVAILIASMLIAAGCQSQGDDVPRSDGPLYSGDTAGTLCVPKFRAGGKLSHGSEFIENTGDDSIHIDAVKLVNANGFTLLAAYTRPADRGLSGTGVGWPAIAMSEMQPIEELGPSVERNLVLELEAEPSADEASLDGVELLYSVGSHPYVARTSLAVVWRPSC